jgi:hypothetical protein
MRQTIVSLDDGHLAAKTAHGLGQFKPDVAAAKDQEMPGNVIQFHGFDVREWPRLLQSRSGMDGRAGPCVDHHVLAEKCAHSSFRESDFDGFRPHEASGTHDKLRTTLLVVAEMHVDQTGHHFALAITDRGHVDAGVVLPDAEFLAAEEIGSHLGTVNDVLTREAGNVGTRATDPLSLDDNGFLSLLGQGPGNVLSGLPAAEDHEVVVFRW